MKQNNPPENNPQTETPASEFSEDRLTEKIGILTRRETEARILIPVIRDLAARFGTEAVIAVMTDTITRIAEEQGRDLARAMGGNGPEAFKAGLHFWTRDDALSIEIREASATRLAYDVIRCRYAEMYGALGASELGAVFSCNRDAALIRGFNPAARMERTCTIMEGAGRCDFVYTFPGAGEDSGDL